MVPLKDAVYSQQADEAPAIGAQLHQAFGGALGDGIGGFVAQDHDNGGNAGEEDAQAAGHQDLQADGMAGDDEDQTDQRADFADQDDGLSLFALGAIGGDGQDQGGDNAGDGKDGAEGADEQAIHAAAIEELQDGLHEGGEGEIYPLQQPENQ